MKILAWTIYYWIDAEHAKRDSGKWCGLESWSKRIDALNPVDKFVACGTWSDPKFCPVVGLRVINSGILNSDHPYSGRYQYGKAAITAGIAHALNISNQWDVLILIDADTIIRTDLMATITQFADRPENLMAGVWMNPQCPGGPLFAWKHDGAVKFLHSRLGPNICPEGPEPPLFEEECAQIYRSDWWNPWPQFPYMSNRYNSDENAKTWPLIGRASDAIVKLFGC